MEKYIEIKRTKMVDEAALGHQPMFITTSMIRFVFVFLLGTLLGNLISAIPLGIYLFTKTDFLELTLSQDITPEQYVESVAEIFNNIPPVFTVISLLCTAGTIAAAIFYCKVFEKRKIASMGLRSGNAGTEYLVGALIGVIMYVLAFVIAYASGSVTIKMNPQGFMPIIILFLVGYIVQGAAEELLVRGYFMISVARDYKPWIALIVSSTAFSALHAFNAGVSTIALINIFLFGIFMGIYVFKRGNIWGACAIHSFWNFAQGNIFGSYVSGNPIAPSVFLMEYDPARVYANGGQFGLEGGVSATIVLVVAIGVSLLMKTKKSEISALEQSFVVE